MIEIEKKITNHGHDKYIATPEFNTLTSEHFASKANIANKFSKKIYYCCFRKKDRFWWKAKNKLSKKVKAISSKGLTKDLINNIIFLMEQNTLLQERFKII